MVLVNVDIAGEQDDFSVNHIYQTAGVNYEAEVDLSNGTWSYQRTGTGASQFTGRRVFFLFRGITIPQFSIISDATLSINDMEVSTPIPSFTIRAVNNSAPTNVGGGYGTATGTGAVFNTPVVTPVATFTGTNTTIATDYPVDVKSIVQALVNSFDYSNDNMMFRMSKKPVTTTQQFNAQNFEYQVNPPDSIANLTINFSLGQLCIPTSDVSNAGVWEDVTLGNGDTSLFNEIDDLASDSAISAIRGKLNAVVSDTFEVRLNPCFDPLSSTDHTIRISARGNGNQIKIQLFQGAVLVAESGNFTLTNDFQAFEYILSGGEADSITDYNNLRIRVIPNVVI